MEVQMSNRRKVIERCHNLKNLRRGNGGNRECGVDSD